MFRDADMINVLIPEFSDNLKDVSYMFKNNSYKLYDQEAITKFESYVWNTKSITDMSYMFSKSSGINNNTGKKY